jgi:hypothetical protein
MTHRSLLVIVPFLLTMHSEPARAEDSPRVGLTIGYPASVGLLWHISDRLAVRPDFGFSWTSSEAPSSSAIGLSSASNSSTRAAVGIGGLIYVAKWEALRTYLAPRFGYSRGTSTTEGTSTSISFTSFPPITETTTTSSYTTTTKSSIYEASGSFGAEYTLGTRFGVFAEVGVAFTHVPSPSVSSNRTPTLPTVDLGGSKGVGTRSGIGAIVYF